MGAPSTTTTERRRMSTHGQSSRMGRAVGTATATPVPHLHIRYLSFGAVLLLLLDDSNSYSHTLEGGKRATRPPRFLMLTTAARTLVGRPTSDTKPSFRPPPEHPHADGMMVDISITPKHDDGGALVDAPPRHKKNKVKQQTYMARLILKMQQCLSELGVDASAESCLQRTERMAILIHESMSLSSRNYHSVQHVFDVTHNLDDPVCVLAALFHDCVYFHVDGGLSERQQLILRGDVVAVVEKSPKVGYCQLRPDYEHDELLRMVVLIFGVDALEDRRLTPANGVNEFLSALIAVRELEPLLPSHHLAEIACCIEATIPFRPTTNETGTPMDRLFQRMQKTQQLLPHRFGPQLATDIQLVHAVQRAVSLSNEDVGNFSTDDPGCFLDNTWNLLPESNEALRHEYLYTVREFTSAVHKMHGFFAYFLKPGLIFQQFRGVPTPEELQKRIDNADRNVQVGRKYLSAKLLSLSMLSALAELSGGDAPIAMFMGDLPSRNRWSRRLEDALDLPRFDDEKGQESTEGVPPHCDADVYRLLSHGRKSDTAFDIRQSPLAAYLYASLGDDGVERLVRDNLQTFPLSKEGASALLQRLPRPLMTHVAENVAKIAQSRSSRILQIVRDMPPE